MRSSRWWIAGWLSMCLFTIELTLDLLDPLSANVA